MLNENNKYCDGGGLTLEVTSANSKIWRVRYRHPQTKKEQTFTIGKYPLVSLQEAREARDEAKKLINNLIDPNQEKMKTKQAKVRSHEDTFKKIAEEWLNLRTLAEKQDGEVVRRLNHDVFPFIGDSSIEWLTKEYIYEKIFTPLLNRGVLTVAKKVKQNLNGIFEYARKTKGIITTNPITDIDLPAPKGKHHAAITKSNDLKEFIKDAWAYIDRPRVYPVTAYALQLSVLIFQRPIEIRSLKWECYKENYSDEIQGKYLDVTPSKNFNSNSIRSNLIIPLPPLATDIMEELYKFTGHTEYVFYSPTGSEPYLSEGTVNNAIKSLSDGKYIGKQTAHGLRATAATILEERLNQPKTWIEAQLAHKVKDMNGESYNRTEHIKNRLTLLTTWENYINTINL